MPSGCCKPRRFRHLFAGLLCTIDIASDPIAVYDALRALLPPRVNSSCPTPPGTTRQSVHQGADSEYADWLIAIFDRWVANGRPFRGPDLRVGPVYADRRPGALTESLGLTPSDLAVVETDGSSEQVNWLKRAYEWRTGNGSDRIHGSAGHSGAAPGDRRPAAGPERPV